jgi:hypothetical protein
MMKAELEQRLQATSKEHLVRLLQELIDRYPTLLVEMGGILESFTVKSGPLKENDDEVEITEDWDFSGEGPVEGYASLLRPPSASVLQQSQTAQQRVEAFTARLQQQDSSPGLANDLSELIDEASERISQHDPETGLSLYAFMIDERLLERNSILSPVFDDMIDTALPTLEEALLAEFTANSIFDDDAASFTRQLTSHARQRWLERLFALWLKRLDAHRVEEDLPELLLDVAWNEDVLLLRSLAQNALQRPLYNEYANIVDFSRQYRTRALEKFLLELPRT